MRPAWLLIVCAGGLVVGCAHDRDSHNYPPDPLLLSHRPVAGKPSAASTPAPEFARHEPPAPESLLAQGAKGTWPPVGTVPVLRTDGEREP
jgi:hypothetical protein